jgi:hypothetical protein
MVTLLAYECPEYLQDDINDWWDDYWDEFPWWVQLLQFPGNLGRVKASLFVAYGDLFDLGQDFNLYSPQRYAHELVQELDGGVGQGHYDIRSFCILNEPNTISINGWPEDRFRLLVIPYDNGWVYKTITVVVHGWFHDWSYTASVRVHEILFVTYSTVNLCSDLLFEVQHTIDTDCNNLNDVDLVVNLFSYAKGWLNPLWVGLSIHPDLDVLGIDLYWNQPHCTVTPMALSALETLSIATGHEWWVVEMPGAENPGRVLPMAVHVFILARWFRLMGATVTGHYRLWGPVPPVGINYGAAYNIWEMDDEDDDTPTAAVDNTNEIFWQWISVI